MHCQSALVGLCYGWGLTVLSVVFGHNCAKQIDQKAQPKQTRDHAKCFSDGVCRLWQATGDTPTADSRALLLLTCHSVLCLPETEMLKRKQ